MKREPPKIVAEISGNHCGYPDRAAKLIREAKNAGCDAVKVQLWSGHKMTAGPGPVLKSGLWAGRQLADLYKEAQLPWGAMPALMALADDIGIELFASVFDLEALQYLESVGCPRYKIASFEILDQQLIMAVAKTNRPLIISTGLATDEDIEWALNAAACGRGSVTLLHCISDYPAPPDTMELSRMLSLQVQFGLPVGLSDHTVGCSAGIIAAALGAPILEKHMTLDDRAGIDGAFSATPAEMQEYVERCKEASQMWQPRDPRDMSEARKEYRSLRRTAHWARTVKAGGFANEADIKMARPGGGLSWLGAHSQLGKRLTRQVEENDPIKESDFEQP
jgi:sialic acid synthase SpsE